METELKEILNAGTVTKTPELDLSLSDAELIDLISRKLSEYRQMTEGKEGGRSVSQRSADMVRYWRGTQERDRRRGRPDKRYRNNIIHRDLATRVQNATSRMPDVVVISPQQDESPDVKDQTKKVEEWLAIEVDSDVTRRLAQGALRDNHLKFIGIWKHRYDHVKRRSVTERLRPQDVVLDATARIPEDGYTTDNMEFIGEWCEDYTSNVLAQYPDKREELLAEISKEQANGKPASSKIRYLQTTARVSGKDGKPRIILVNSYNDILLSKGLHPDWDWREDGDQQFGLVPEEKLHPEISAMLPSLGLDQPKPPAPKRKNFFPFPRMPYTLFSGENLGDGPLDDTTVVEQALPMQDILNERGDQITQINDWAVPKTAVSTRGITAEKSSNITRDASEIVSVKVEEGERIQDHIYTWTGEPASAALYQDLQRAEQAIDSHFSTSAAVRGEAVEPESGVSKQISREGNLAASDDIAQTMVQRAVEEAVNWRVQHAKIYFDEPVRNVSPQVGGGLRSAEISRDLIPDDIQIVVKANAVDKMTQRNMAMNLVGAKGIDPYNLFVDLGFSDPKKRAEALVDFLSGEANGYARYLADIGISPGDPAGQQTEGAAAGMLPPQGAPTPSAPPPTAPPMAPPGSPVPPQAPPLPPAPATVAAQPQ